MYTENSTVVWEPWGYGTKRSYWNYSQSQSGLGESVSCYTNLHNVN